MTAQYWPKTTTTKNSAQTVLLVDAVSGMGGAEHSLLDLIDHIDSKRYRFRALLLNDGKLREELERRHVHVDVVPIEFPLQRMFRWNILVRNLKSWVQVYNIIKKSNIDLIHCYSVFGLKIYFPAFYFVRLPFIQHANNLDEDQFLTYRIAIALRARVVTAVSDAVRKKTVSGIPFLRKRVVRIANSVDVSKFRPARTSLTIRKKLKLPQRAFLFGVSARFAPVKDYFTFLRAAEQLLQNGVQADFVLVGDVVNPEIFPWDAEYKAEVLDYVREHKLTRHVHVLGHRDDMPEVYRCFNALVMPASREAFGRVTIEAMASGVPVIGANAGGTPEVISHEKNGLLFKPGDAIDLARMMKRIYEDKNLYTLIKRNALEDVATRYNSTMRAKKFQEVYEHVISGKSIRILTNRQ